LLLYSQFGAKIPTLFVIAHSLRWSEISLSKILTTGVTSTVAYSNYTGGKRVHCLWASTQIGTPAFRFRFFTPLSVTSPPCLSFYGALEIMFFTLTVFSLFSLTE